MSRAATKPTAGAAAAAAMTTPAQLERLGDHLKKLRLVKSSERLEALLQEAAANELPYAEFLEQVLAEEVAAETSKNIAMRTTIAARTSRDRAGRRACLPEGRQATLTKHLLIQMHRDNDVETVARLTELARNRYGAAFRSHTGRWEPLPIDGDLKHAADAVTTLLAPYFEP